MGLGQEDVTQQGVDESSQGQVPSAVSGDGTDGSDGSGQVVEVGGKQYPADRVAAALDALDNKESWEKDYKRRDQSLAGVRREVEFAFGKRATDLDAVDLNDLRAFGIFNNRLRSDPEFAKAWESALIAAYKREGMPTSEAKTQAKVDVAQAKDQAGQQKFELPQDVREKLGKVDALERLLMQRDNAAAIGQLQNVIDQRLQGSIAKYAGDMGIWKGFIARHVLYGLAGYEDAELAEAAQDGALDREIGELTKAAIKMIKDHAAAEGKGKATAIAAGKAGAGIAPIRGTAGRPSTDENAAVAGHGLAGMHGKMREALRAIREEAGS